MQRIRPKRLLPALLALIAPLWAACSQTPSGPGAGVSTAICVTDMACPIGQECGAGVCEDLAPGLFPHIQTASALFRDHSGADEVTWRAFHYDVIIGRVVGVSDDIRAANPGAHLFEYTNIRYHRYDEYFNHATDWANAHGVDPENFYLHYREDVPVPTWEGVELVAGFPPGVVPGWVPGVSPAPGASAQTRDQSRAIGYDVGASAPWYLANITDGAFRRFLVDWTATVVDGTVDGAPPAAAPLDGVVADNAIYYPQFGEGVLDKTDEFYGVPLDEQHPYAVGFETIYPELAAGLAERFGRAIDVMPNYGHVSFLEYPNRAAQNVVASTPWIWAEIWLLYYGWSTPTTGTLRAITYDNDYRNAILPVIRQTRGSKRRVLGARDLSHLSLGTDRGKLFTLALYYLVHNVNTFYLYETVTSRANPDPIGQWQWNPAVEFDIGQPDQIPPGTLDFDGNFPSMEHYVFASGADPYRPDLTYRVLARRFTNALVMAKMLPAGSVVGNASATTHALDGAYAILGADGSLGEVVTSVTLRNNEGAILIPVD